MIPVEIFRLFIICLTLNKKLSLVFIPTLRIVFAIKVYRKLKRQPVLKMYIQVVQIDNKHLPFLSLRIFKCFNVSKLEVRLD